MTEDRANKKTASRARYLLSNPFQAHWISKISFVSPKSRAQLKLFFHVVIEGVEDGGAVVKYGF